MLFYCYPRIVLIKDIDCILSVISTQPRNVIRKARERHCTVLSCVVFWFRFSTAASVTSTWVFVLRDMFSAITNMFGFLYIYEIVTIFFEYLQCLIRMQSSKFVVKVCEHIYLICWLEKLGHRCSILCWHYCFSLWINEIWEAISTLVNHNYDFNPIISTFTQSFSSFYVIILDFFLWHVEFYVIMTSYLII